MKVPTIVIECNECGDGFQPDPPPTSIGQARALAAAEGWCSNAARNFDLCADCAGDGGDWDDDDLFGDPEPDERPIVLVPLPPPSPEAVAAAAGIRPLVSRE